MSEDPVTPEDRVYQKLAIAFDLLTNLANNGTELTARLNQHVKTLSFELETARGEIGILTKAVGHILGREASQARNPAQTLGAFLGPLNAAADIFAPDPIPDELKKIYKDAGLVIPEPTQEEKDIAERDAVISESYRTIAQHLKEEAMKVISAARR